MSFNVGAALSLPVTVWGYFEWFTGTVRINMDAKAFEKGTLTPSEKLGLDETYSHEFLHCCQICTTGYLHYYVAQFLKGIAPVWRKITEEGVMAKRTMPLILYEVFKERPKLTDDMLDLLSNLDKTGESKIITARSIIEGQAYFVQKQMNIPNLTHEQFIDTLKLTSTGEYSDAYLVATSYLGSKAFTYFNAIAYSTLLFLEPQNVFEKICYHLSKSSFIEKDFEKELERIITELKKNYFFLGDSEDVRNTYISNKEINPFYKTSIELLRSICKERGMTYFSMMSDPKAWLGDIINQFDVPIIFNDGEVYEHGAEKKWEVFDRSVNKTLHLVLGAICLIIGNQRHDFAPRYLHSRK